MRRLTVVLVLGLVLFGGQAVAKDMKGKFGVGGKASLGGVVGFDLIYWLGDIGIETILDFDLYKPDGGNSQLKFSGSLGAIYNVAKSQNANFGIGLRVNIGVSRLTNPTKTLVQVNLEIPLRVEYFFSDYFAIHFEVGLTFEFYGNDGPVLSAEGQLTGPGGSGVTRTGKGFGFGAGTGLIGSGGFVFYF